MPGVRDEDFVSSGQDPEAIRDRHLDDAVSVSPTEMAYEGALSAPWVSQQLLGPDRLIW